MNKISVFAGLVLSFFAIGAFAGSSLKPGLWKVTATVSAGGKQINASEQMQKAMAKMNPEQRKKMEAMMKQHHIQQPSSDGVKVCYTEEQLKHDAAFYHNEAKHTCTSKQIMKSANRTKFDINCKDGTKGTAEWTVVSSTNYTGKIDSVSPKTGKTDISIEGTFVSTNCGTVKPFNIGDVGKTK